MINAHDMLDALVQRYKGNAQIKRSKIIGLETQFENFRIEENEIIENMYSRLALLINEFIDMGEPLSNNKIVGKIIRAMLRRLRWEGFVSALETIQGASYNPFIPDELYVHLRSFEETL
jgi:gag-polypeptide of LTR copia-type